ncbi:MAG TPA: energy transducer TonB [Pyrinomonadaceae bacterium]
MQHFAVRIAVAFLTFIIGTAASAMWGLFNMSRATVTQGQFVYVGTKSCPSTRPAADIPPPPPPPSFNGPTINGGILNGKAISKPAPAYPAIAKAARASGTVVVRIIVDESGRVSEAEAISGHPLLQQAAVAAVRQWRFSPTLLSGQPVKVAGTVSVNFNLQ